LSKNLILVDDIPVEQFNTVKLKHKSAIMIGNQLLFFIYSKNLLGNYCKTKLEKLAKQKDICIPQVTLLQGEMNGNGNLQPEKKADNIIKISNRGIAHHKKKHNKEKKENKVGNNSNNDFKNGITFDLTPPNFNNIRNDETDNILDDLIDPPKTKIKIPNTVNSKSIIINDKDINQII
jgi:hypothetical protein